MNMNDAPKDGTRVLLKCKSMHYHHGRNAYIHDGYHILEARWVEYDEENDWGDQSRWEEWCGNEQTSSTNHPMPVAWYPIPDELKDEHFSGEEG